EMFYEAVDENMAALGNLGADGIALDDERRQEQFCEAKSKQNCQRQFPEKPFAMARPPIHDVSLQFVRPTAFRRRGWQQPPTARGTLRRHAPSRDAHEPRDREQ